MGRIPRTVICGALGFALVFSLGTAPVNAQDAVTPTATAHPGISPEEPAPAAGTPPVQPPTLEAGTPAVVDPGSAADSEGTVPAGGPEPAPTLADNAPSPAPTMETPEPAAPTPAAAVESDNGQPSDQPGKETAETKASPSAAFQPAPSPSASPSPSATRSPSATPAPSATPDPAPTTPDVPIEGPGAYMGLGMAMTPAEIEEETPMNLPSRLLSEVAEPVAKAAAIVAALPIPAAARMAVAVPLAAAKSMAVRAQWIPVGVQGMDVSGWQADSGYTRSTVNWSGEWSKGARFVYVKATEGNNFIDQSRTSHLAGAAKVGMLHGAYHFALPGQSTATAQADHFVRNGGRWTGDGNTLPPLLDIENNPYGANCYGLSQSAMVTWIKTFSNRVLSQTGRLPMIYTNKGWWVSCTGDSRAFTNQPLHIAAYTGGAPLQIPGGWPFYSMWQFSSTGPFAGDSNVWNGTLTSLKTFARESGQRPVVSRVDGKDRYEVSAAVSRSTFPAGTQTAYVASGGIYTDALSGSAPAGHIGGPVLLTATDVLPYAIRDELRRLSPQRIVVLGGPPSVSNGVMALLRDYAPSVERMDGKDRYEVSAAVSRSTYWVGTEIAYVASGAIYTDALSGSAAAAHNGSPVLLTDPTVLPDVIRIEIQRLKPRKIVILGGPGTVSNGVMGQLRNYAPSVTRMDGKDRYEVSANVSRATFSPGVRTAYIASGGIYTDALSGSAAAGYVDGPVLLTSPTVLPDVIRAELKRLKPQRIVILGGSGTVSNAVMKTLQTYNP